MKNTEAIGYRLRGCTIKRSPTWDERMLVHATINSRSSRGASPHPPRTQSNQPFSQTIPGAIDSPWGAFHLLLLAVAFLMIGAAVFASDSVSNPSTAENLRPIDRS